MSAAIVLTCDGHGCRATYTTVSRDFPAARLEGDLHGWSVRGIAGRDSTDLCPACRSSTAAARIDAARSAWETEREAAAAFIDPKPIPEPRPSAADAWRCHTCGAPQDAHPYRHPFTYPRHARATRAQETR